MFIQKWRRKISGREHKDKDDKNCGVLKIVETDFYDSKTWLCITYCEKAKDDKTFEIIYFKNKVFAITLFTIRNEITNWQFGRKEGYINYINQTAFIVPLQVNGF